MTTLQDYRQTILNAALIQAKLQLQQLFGVKNSPLAAGCEAGYMRGIDFYSQTDLPLAMANSMTLFFGAHGYFPNLMSPRGFNEKIVWSKFFIPFKIPESGNKLLTATFIPGHLKNEIRCPDIVWHSPAARLPGNDEVAAGFYYLKATHGSGMFRRIRYPLQDQERAELETLAAEWLKNTYGILDGEWWYNVFEKQIMLEKEICPPAGSIAWMYYIFSGKVGFIATCRKTPAGEEISWLDSELNLLPYQNPDKSRVQNLQDYRSLNARLKFLASGIASASRFVRVDFLIDPENIPYLGEITFTPGNGMTRRPPHVEKALGDLWNVDDLGVMV